MKNVGLDIAVFWTDLPVGQKGQNPRGFFALRDESKEYLGCPETTQNISGHKSTIGEKRLLDFNHTWEENR
jgi:DUF438 domain-containing protein